MHILIIAILVGAAVVAVVTSNRNKGAARASTAKPAAAPAAKKKAARPAKAAKAKKAPAKAKKAKTTKVKAAKKAKAPKVKTTPAKIKKKSPATKPKAKSAGGAKPRAAATAKPKSTPASKESDEKSTYPDGVAKVKKLTRAKKTGDAVKLLTELVGITEVVSKKSGNSVDPWCYEQLAVIHRNSKDYASEIAILERYGRQHIPAGPASTKLAQRLSAARTLQKQKG